ncbi:MAG: hypothetical protein QM811_17450 [Pirellulales bacterium]
MLALVCSTQGQSIANAALVSLDDFETSTHATADRKIAGSVGIPFYLANSGEAAATAKIEFDSELNSNALVVRPPTANTSSPIVGLLPGVGYLSQNGDSLLLSFRFRFLNPSATSGNANNFRFGVYYGNRNSTPVDGQSELSANVAGYLVQFGDSAQSAGSLMQKETGKLPPILGGSTDRSAISTPPTVGLPAITDTKFHTVEFSLTRLTLSTIGLSLKVDDQTPITAVENFVLYSQLNQIAFSNGFVSNSMQFAIDDVRVDAGNFIFNPVPEPSWISACFVIGMLALVKYRICVPCY